MSLGVLTRLSTSVTFVVVAGNLLLSETHFRHNRAFLAILLFGLALLPTGRTRSFDAWWRRRRGLAAAAPGGAAVATGAAARPGVPRLLRLGLQQAGRSRLAGRAGALGSGRPVPARSSTRRPAGWSTSSRGARSSTSWRPSPSSPSCSWPSGSGCPAPGSSPSASPSSSTSPSSSARGSRCSASRRSPRSSSGSPHADATASSASARSTRSARVLARAVPLLDWLDRFTIEPSCPEDPDVVMVDRDGTTLHGRAARARHRRTTASDVPTRSLGPSVRHRRLLATAAVWLVGFGVLRVSLLAPEKCPTISKADGGRLRDRRGGVVGGRAAGRRALPLRVRPCHRPARGGLQPRAPRRRDDVALPARGRRSRRCA